MSHSARCAVRGACSSGSPLATRMLLRALATALALALEQQFGARRLARAQLGARPAHTRKQPRTPAGHCHIALTPPLATSHNGGRRAGSAIYYAKPHDHT